ncbi:hypothetical protein Tco_1130364, partial [Tanacetum coccineum]
AYLDGTNTESEPFEDPIKTETPEPPLTVAPPTSLPEITPPTLVPILRRTARMAVRVPPAMSLGLSTSMVEVATMSESAFCKRFRSSYESSPSLSPLDLPSRKHYQSTFELVEDDEEDDDDEIEESLDSDSVSEDAKDEGPTAEEEDSTTWDEGLAAGDEGLEEEAIPEGQQQEVPVVETAMSAPLGLGCGELRRRELALEEDHVYNTLEVGQGSGSAPEPERPERVSAFGQSTLTTWTDPKDAPFIAPLHISSPMIPLTGGLIRDHVVPLEELSPALFKRSLEHKQERVVVTFGVLWRLVLALDSWAGQTDAQRAAL